MNDGEDGFMTKGLDLDALTAAVKQLVDDPELRLKMGRLARARVAVRDWSLAARLFWEGSPE